MENILIDKVWGIGRQSGGKGRNPAGARVASAGEREGAAGEDLRPPGALPTAPPTAAPPAPPIKLEGDTAGATTPPSSGSDRSGVVGVLFGREEGQRRND